MTSTCFGSLHELDQAGPQLQQPMQCLTRTDGVWCLHVCVPAMSNRATCLHAQLDDLEEEPKQPKAKWYWRLSFWHRALPVLATCCLLVIAALFRRFGPEQVSSVLQEHMSHLCSCVLLYNQAFVIWTCFCNWHSQPSSGLPVSNAASTLRRS